MKKLLSILAAVTLTATSATSVVACSNNMYTKAKTNTGNKDVDHSYDDQIIQASLIARAKSIILDDMYGFDDSVTKDYALENNTISSLVGGVDNKDIANTKISDRYESFINDDSLASVAKKSNVNINGGVGQEGGILTFVTQSSIEGLLTAMGIPSAVQGPIESLFNLILSAFGVNTSTAVSISETIKPLLQAMGKVNTKVAMEGIPFGLGLIPDLSSSDALFSKVLSPLVNALTGTAKTTINNGIDELSSATDFSKLSAGAQENNGKKYSDLDFAGMQNEINYLLQQLISGKDTFINSLKFISLVGDYMSFFNHDSSDVLNVMNTSSSKKTSDSIFYKASDGAGFSLAPVLNEAAYYLGNGINETSVLRFCQILFLTVENGTVSLNPIGKSIVDGPIRTLMISLLNDGYIKGDNLLTISKERCEDLFLLTLVNDNKADGSKLPDGLEIGYSENSSILGDATALFPTVSGTADKPGTVIYKNWEKLGKIYADGKTDNVDVSKALKNDNTLQRVFLDDNTNKTNDFSLESLLNAPIYKLLMLDASLKAYQNQTKDEQLNQFNPLSLISNGPNTKGFGEKGFGISDLEDNNGLLPNYAGYYTQESIVQLAAEIKTMFGLGSEDATNESIQYHFFNFAKMKPLVDELLFGIDGKPSLLQTLLNNIGKPRPDVTIASAIGYYTETDSKDFTKWNINSKFVKKDSWMGHLMSALIPELDDASAPNQEFSDAGLSPDDYFDDNELSENLLDESDNLQFLFEGVTAFLTNVIKPTNYDYWLSKTFNTYYDNMDNDPTSKGKSVWFYKYQQADPWSGFPNYGIDTTYFDGTKDIKSMSLIIKLDLSKMPSVISLVPADKAKPKTYKFVISRDNANDTLAFSEISKL